ncbi:hypothetical protein CTI10_008455 [Delftia acidovorans]|uniref:Uncharacterized protein n=1 Tax=Chryseobacterium sp. B5 TaxID=2050562 RepID=A0A2G7T9E2_9FLAO|nr:hypothetical protein CTI10_008455 [Delftia acidovorans]
MAQPRVRVADPHVICFDDAGGLKQKGTIWFPRGIERLQRSERKRVRPLSQYILNVNNCDCH